MNAHQIHCQSADRMAAQSRLEELRRARQQMQAERQYRQEARLDYSVVRFYQPPSVPDLDFFLDSMQSSAFQDLQYYRHQVVTDVELHQLQHYLGPNAMFLMQDRSSPDSDDELEYDPDDEQFLPWYFVVLDRRWYPYVLNSGEQNVELFIGSTRSMTDDQVVRYCQELIQCGHGFVDMQVLRAVRAVVLNLQHNDLVIVQREDYSDNQVQ